MKKSGLLIVFFGVSTMGYYTAMGQNKLEGGVQFRSYETIKDQRTGINLTPDGPLQNVSTLEIQFDLKYWRQDRDFGPILRIIGEKQENIDLVSLPPVRGEENLLVVVGENSTNIAFSWEEINADNPDWMNLTLTLNHNAKSVALTVRDGSGNIRLRQEDSLPTTQKDYFIVFGKNELPGIRTSDVPPIQIKDIRLSIDGSTTAHWPLVKHYGATSYDELHARPLEVHNGRWLINRHVAWSAIDSIRMPLRPQVTSNGEDELYFLTADRLFQYNLTNGDIKRTQLSTSTALPMSQQSVYNPGNHQIWTYDFDELMINKFDLQQLEWVDAPADFHKEPRHWHINKVLNEGGDTFFFGGYGFHRYKNAFYAYTDGEWQTKVLEDISPRYLSASGMTSKGQMVVFGGYGNSSGLQEEGTKSFYGCYLIDPNQGTVTKLWELEPPVADFTHSNSLIVDEKDSSFLVLSYRNDLYHTYAYLEQYSLATGEKTVFDDSLKFRFDDTSSYADLLVDARNKRLIALLVEKDERGYVAYLHGLNMPAVQAAAALQPDLASNESLLWQYILVGFLLVGGALATYMVTRDKRKTKALHALLDTTPFEPQRSAILIMGGFQVFDKEGNNITKKFSATLKLLFCLILLHSQNGRKGVSSQRIWEEVWGDKPENKARNNRNVNINKLREILSAVGDIQIVGEANRWKMVIGEDVFCDYQYVCRILSRDESEPIPPDIIPLAEKGNILPGMETEWLDDFKSDFSNRLVDRLLAINIRNKLPNSVKVQLANAIFKFDMIDREALFIKCRALADDGKYALAKESYEHFAKEYEHMYNEPFDIKFEQIMHPETA